MTQEILENDRTFQLKCAAIEKFIATTRFPHAFHTLLTPKPHASHTLVCYDVAINADDTEKRQNGEGSSMSLRVKLPRYRAQILRMWVESTHQSQPCWRFSLEDVETGERNGFADLDTLICHLLDLMAEQTNQPSRPS
jgi:hypothetical protein